MPHTVDEALSKFNLIAGSGSESSKEACAMTLLAWMADKEWTDHPSCAHPIIANNVISANDHPDTTPEMRCELVKLGQEGVLDTWWVPDEVILWAMAGPNTGQFKRTKRLLKSVAAWKRSDKERPNLYGANLCGANLYEANLRGANLRGANLREADLREATLYGANLYGANLYGANLYGANLYGANLREATLYGANLREANLYGANLCGANLREATLYGANLREANLYGANLYEANLRGANLRGADASSSTFPPVGYRVENERIVKV